MNATKLGYGNGFFGVQEGAVKSFQGTQYSSVQASQLLLQISILVAGSARRYTGGFGTDSRGGLSAYLGLCGCSYGRGFGTYGGFGRLSLGGYQNGNTFYPWQAPGLPLSSINQPPARYEPMANEPPKTKVQTGVLWDVWFDHEDGGETKRRSPIVLDLNRNGKPDITGANITGNDPIQWRHHDVRHRPHAQHLRV